MLSKIKELMKINQTVKDLDLEELLSPKRIAIAKFPRRKKTYRTLSLAKVLRKLGKEYWYFNDNIIVMEFLYGKGFKKKVLMILGNEHCYRVRVDIWSLTGGGNFYYKEYEYPTGSSILFELVCSEILDNSFVPDVNNFTNLNKEI
jgi:hypothetical protein